MTCGRAQRRRISVCAALFTILAFTGVSSAQEQIYERAFSQSKTTVEAILKQMQFFLSGRLPVLDGFAADTARPLERYRLGYYRAVAQVSSTASGGCLVRVSAKITAWYADPKASQSGYQLVVSNGRLETDILNQLSQEIAANTPPVENIDSKPQPFTRDPDPAPFIDRAARSTFSGAFSQTLPPRGNATSPGSPTPTNESQKELQAELGALEEALKNQAHPKNLAAVRKSGTAVVSAPSLKARTLFQASAHDEFEILDFSEDWVHVRVSGLSRGWIWRNDLEMPDDVPDTQARPTSATNGGRFRVAQEETALFPGDWEPLRGKKVRILSVQRMDDPSGDGSPQAKLDFARFLFGRNYPELADKSQDLRGVVLIFDSSDGGMIAATALALEQWKRGEFSEAAFWRRCFFDPPEPFTGSGISPIQ